MNEIALSDDLNVITAEINSYKQVAGQAIFEIGKRLKHVKENDLAHGEWLNWLESIEMDRRRASEFIKVYDELGSSNVQASGHLGSKALYLIASMPTEEREKKHVLSNGDMKKPDEMTNKELQEVKRQLKEERQAKQQAEQQRDIERKERERLEEQEPEQIEVVPDDYDYYKGNYKAAVDMRDRYKEQLEEMREELNNKEPEVKEVIPEETQQEMEHLKKMIDLGQKAIEEKQTQIDAYEMKDTSNFDEAAGEWELKKLQNEADRNTTEIRVAFKQLNDKVSVSRYMYDAISAGSDYEKKRMREEVGITKEVISSIEASLNNRREIN